MNQKSFDQLGNSPVFNVHIDLRRGVCFDDTKVVYGFFWVLIVAISAIAMALCFFKSTAVAQVASTNIEAHHQLVSKDSIEKLNQVVEGYVTEKMAVGAEILVIQNGKTLLHRAYGFSDKADDLQWKTNTICNIRSMTKPITSAAAQILVDRGKLDLDQPVSSYLDSFDNDKSRLITVRQVLTHRSGLPLTILLMPHQFKNLEDQVAASAKKGPDHEPGSKFWYSDAGTDVVARLVEKVSGETIDTFVTREIFKPLEMDDSFYGIDPEDKRLQATVSLYMGGPKNWNRIWKPGKTPMYPFGWGSQTVYATTGDYLRFLGMIANHGRTGDRQILSEAAIARMLEPVSEMTMMGSDASFPTGFNNMKTYYGQMMVTYRDYRAKDPKLAKPFVIGHSGSDGTASWAIPDRNILIAYFTQSRGGRTALSIEEAIDQFVIHDGKPIKVDVPNDLQPFLGKYLANFANFKNEEFTVKFKSGHLILDVPSQLPFVLLPPDEDGFHCFEISPDRAKVKFVKDKGGKVTGLKLHQGDKIFEVPRVTNVGTEKNEG